MKLLGKAVPTHTSTRLTRLMSALTFLLLLASLIVVSAGCANGQAKPNKAPAPAVSPKPVVKACPASSRYNPKTHACDKIRL